MKLKVLLVAALVCALLAGGTSCRQELRAEEKGKVRVGIVFDIGGKDDRSFNAAAYDGVKCAETGRHPDGTPCDKPSLGMLNAVVAKAHVAAMEGDAPRALRLASAANALEENAGMWAFPPIQARQAHWPKRVRTKRWLVS